jgi:adenylate cyclase
VLPFADLTGGSDQSYFAYGLTEDIITRLSRFQDLKAIGRNSTMQYEGRTVDAREVGRDLGVQFVVEGSVRRTSPSPTKPRGRSPLRRAAP